MTNLEWQQLADVVSQMTAEERDRLVALVNQAPSREPPASGPILGLMADEPELMDAVVAAAYFAREHQPLRLPADG